MNVLATYPFQLDVFKSELTVEDLRIVWRGAILVVKCNKVLAEVIANSYGPGS